MNEPPHLSLHDNVKEGCLQLFSETNEILNEVNWKTWKRTQKTLDLLSLKKEVVDLLMVTFNMCHIVGLTYSELCELVDKKQNEVKKRAENGY